MDFRELLNELNEIRGSGSRWDDILQELIERLDKRINNPKNNDVKLSIKFDVEVKDWKVTQNGDNYFKATWRSDTVLAAFTSFIQHSCESMEENWITWAKEMVAKMLLIN